MFMLVIDVNVYGRLKNTASQVQSLQHGPSGSYMKLVIACLSPAVSAPPQTWYPGTN